MMMTTQNYTGLIVFIVFIVFAVLLKVLLILRKYKLTLFHPPCTFTGWVENQKHENLALKGKFSDKYQAKIYAEHLARGINVRVAKTYFITSDANDLRQFDFSKYNKVMMKNTSGSGMNMAVALRNNNQTHLETVIEKFKQHLQQCYNCRMEPQYRYHAPKVMIEEYLGDGLVDYKFHMIHGKLAFIEIIMNRGTENICKIITTPDFQILQGVDYAFYGCDPKSRVHEPKSRDAMIQFCYRFCHMNPSLQYVRIDFYDINGTAYFGEFTFTPMACRGAMSLDFNRYLYHHYCARLTAPSKRVS